MFVRRSSVLNGGQINRWLRFAFVGFVLACGAFGTVAFFEITRNRGAILSDFTVFWTAARFPRVYDVAAFTNAQQWLLLPNAGLRPFVYPPTTLLLLKPLALVSYQWGAVLWTLLGLLAFTSATLLYTRKALIGLLNSMVGVTLIAGQISLFSGAALIAGVALIRRNPLFAGALFGLVGATKPQAAVLIPFALVTGRHWKVIAVSALTGAAVGLASLALGFHLWLDWVNALPQFMAQVATPSYAPMNVSLGLWFAPFGLVSVVFVFAKTQKPEIRLLSLVSGTCLCVPYMMIYDLAAIAPAAALLLLKKEIRQVAIGGLAFGSFWLAPVIPIGAVWLVLTDGKKPSFSNKPSGEGNGEALEGA